MRRGSTGAAAAAGAAADAATKWAPEHESILVDWADKALCFRWLHAKSNEYYSRLNTWYTIPVIIMSTLTGTANFALDRFPTEYQGLATIVIGSVNIIAGIITTIAQFLKIAELNEAHRASAVSWSKLYRNIKLELSKAPHERKQVINMLNNSKEEYDRLMETSPSILEKFIQQFKQTYTVTNNDEEFKNLNKPEVCGFIETTANSLYRAVEEQQIAVAPGDDEEQTRLTQQQQKKQIEDFRKRFLEEKMRQPSSVEIDDNFDHVIPLNIIMSVIDDLHSLHSLQAVQAVHDTEV